MRPGEGGERRRPPSAVAADRPFYPFADRLEIMGVGSIVIGVGFFLLATLGTASAAQAALLFSFVVCACAFGVSMVLVSTSRLAKSLEEAPLAPPGARRRSRREVILRSTAHLVGVTALVAVLQVVAVGVHTDLGIAPGILVGFGGLALWNRSTVLQWERRRGRVALAQSEMQWGHIPLYAVDTPKG
jgi:hypothetical protein